MHAPGRTPTLTTTPTPNPNPKQAYKQFGCEEGLGHFEVIYVTAAETQEKFAASFRGMPWLTLPFTHALRREQLRHLFEAS